MEDEKLLRVTRREVIASAGFVPLTAITAAAQAPATALAAPELKRLEAFMERLVPADENGPGAVECGAANYVNRALAGALAGEKAQFLAGLRGVETLAQDIFQTAFVSLTPERKDQLLTSMENGSAAGFPDARAFFARVRRLTLEGMFSDPWYGGNQGFAGWDLIRYPGPRLAVSPEDQKMGSAPKPYRKSAYGTGSEHGH